MPGSYKERPEVTSRDRAREKSLFLYCTFCLLASLFILALDSSLRVPDAIAEIPSPYAVENLTGQRAPDFTLKDLSGRPVSLSSYKGRVVILVFWASWCPPCKEELQSLNKLYNMYKNRGLAILAVSSDRSQSKVADFISQNPVSFTVLFDENLSVSRDLYKAFMVPTTFVIDRRGIISSKHFGEQDWTKPSLLKEIDSLL